MKDDLLFGSLDIPELDKSAALKIVGDLPDDLWFWDSYRAVWMLPMMTIGGHVGREGTRPVQASNANSGLEWVNYAPEIIKNYFEHFVFPWMGTRPRIVILKTAPRSQNNEHIDCTESEFKTRQHKFRLVLSGPTSSLYFLSSEGRLHVPETTLPYIMDGSWPHGMINDSDIPKITICAGAPWNGSALYPRFKHYISRSSIHLPESFHQYFKPSTPTR